jgi:hypothetical protein
MMMTRSYSRCNGRDTDHRGMQDISQQRSLSDGLLLVLCI